MAAVWLESLGIRVSVVKVGLSLPAAVIKIKTFIIQNSLQSPLTLLISVSLNCGFEDFNKREESTTGFQLKW